MEWVIGGLIIFFFIGAFAYIQEKRKKHGKIQFKERVL
jgi:hypothetical protein